MSRFEFLIEWFIIDFKRVNRWSYLKFVSFIFHILVNTLLIASMLELNLFKVLTSPIMNYNWQLVLSVGLLTFPLGLLVRWIDNKEEENRPYSQDNTTLRHEIS